MLMPLISNFPLVAAILAILLAQAVKVPLHYFKKHQWKWALAFSSGGMPSSHSAAVTSLATSVGIIEGVSSSSFAISVVFSAIIMFDASGVRRHAGEHAIILNRMIDASDNLFKELARGNKGKVLKEMLGHQPFEVLMGGLFGILLSFVIYFLFYY
jgi:uncharacterized protein